MWKPRFPAHANRISHFKAIPGLATVKDAMKHPSALGWIHTLLDGATLIADTTPGKDAKRLEITAPEDQQLVSAVDLTSMDRNAFAQLLSAALFYYAEDSELLRVLKLGPTRKPVHLQASRMKDVNAILLLGRDTRVPTDIVHRNPSLGLKYTHR